MPSLFKVGSYVIYFWSGDTDEPMHVHVCKGHPSENATKVWLTSTGGCIVSHNKSKIPQNELNDLLKIISDQFFLICAKWLTYFEKEKIEFYC